MAYTTSPANLFLILAGTMPTAPLAMTFLLLRCFMSSMDVPARQSYVMAVVPPEERAAAASVTNVPRSLAIRDGAAAGRRDAQLFALRMAADLGGLLKAAYDLLLLIQFRSVKPHAGSA